MPSVLNVDTLVAANGTDPVTLTKQSAAKNWVNCSNGGVVNDSFNTSSVTDQATGKYDVTVTNAMSNATYHYSCANVKSGDNSPCAGFNGSLTSTVYRLETTNFSIYIDPDQSTGSLNGDLA